MTPDQHFYVYSAMTQSMGALIALVGVFIVFRIQIQRDRIGGAFERLAQILKISPLLNSRDDILKSADDVLKDGKHHLINRRKDVQREKDNLGRHEDILKYTIDKGKETIALVALLFMYYIIALHSKAYNALFPSARLLVGLVLSMLIIIRLILYLRNCIEPVKGGYL